MKNIFSHRNLCLRSNFQVIARMEIKMTDSRKRQYDRENIRQTMKQTQKRIGRKRKCSLSKYIIIWGLLCLMAYIANVTEFDERITSKTTDSAVISMEQLRTHVNSTAIEEELAELLEKNEEAKEFVENFSNRALYLGQEINLKKDVKNGEVPLFLQWDKRWGYEAYGDSIIGLSGCGPTCLSMAYVYFTDDLTGHPAEMADFCEKKGFYTSVGTSWDLWTVGVEKLGLAGRELSLDEKVMENTLDEGCLIVCSMRPGDFTTTGHYILIHGYGKDGFLVHDPNRKSNSEKQWSYEKLQGQIKNLWAISKP